MGQLCKVRMNPEWFLMPLGKTELQTGRTSIFLSKPLWEMGSITT